MGKDYERNFIEINPEYIGVLHLFKRDTLHSLEGHSLYDMSDSYCGYVSDTMYMESARQFISQLEGHECERFIRCLRDVCNESLLEMQRKRDEFDSKYGDKFGIKKS